MSQRIAEWKDLAPGTKLYGRDCAEPSIEVVEKTLTQLKMQELSTGKVFNVSRKSVETWLWCINQAPKKCSRTACDATRNVICRHTQTGKMYCPRCARAINEHNPGLVEWPTDEQISKERESGAEHATS